jgi:hypothetical protein
LKFDSVLHRYAFVFGFFKAIRRWSVERREFSPLVWLLGEYIASMYCVRVWVGDGRTEIRLWGTMGRMEPAREKAAIASWAVGRYNKTLRDARRGMMPFIFSIFFFIGFILMV